ncbi:MAG TPA: hypothetical protein VFN90_06400 [Gemmatimonadales bacterium]|nr:hypothetical protein [Gemmatimonadales bacterium]
MRSLRWCLSSTALALLAACSDTTTPEPPSTAPGITLTITGTGTATRGATATYTAAITRTNGFTGAVSIAVEGLPTGTTAEPAIIAAGSTSAPVTVAIGQNAVAGQTQLTFRATATGVTARTATARLTVTAPTTGNVTATWTFCAGSGFPLWVAVQDGTGPWTRVTGTGNAYQFTLTSGRGGIAYVISDEGLATTQVAYGSSAELVAMGVGLCSVTTGTKTVTASVPGVTAQSNAIFSLGGAISIASLGETALQFDNVPNGTIDLIGGLSDLLPSPDGLLVEPKRFLIRRGLNPAGNSSLGSLDFDGPDGFAPQEATATITGANGEPLSTLMSYQTTGGTFGTLYSQTDLSGPTSQPIYGVPAARRAGGDLHFLQLATTPLTAPNAIRSRTVLQIFGAFGPRTVSFGADLAAPTVTALGGGRAQLQLPIQAEYGRYWVVGFVQGAGSRSIVMGATAGWLGGGGSITLATPNFAAVNGWNPAWGLTAGPSAWTATAAGWSGTGGITTTPFVDGAVYRSATQQGEIGL